MARINNAWFEFGGVSSASKGLRMLGLPDRMRANQRGDQDAMYNPPGRDGVFTAYEDSYESMELTVRAMLDKTASPAAISGWLRGLGWLRFSDAPDRAYRARAVKSYTYAQQPGRADQQIAEITFLCDPCAYEYPARTVALVSGTPIINPGTRYSEPVITITGSGDIDLTIGAQTLTITGLASAITLDMQARVAYTGTTNLGGIVSGDWPLLIQPGSNAVTITGTVTAATITPNWRWL